MKRVGPFRSKDGAVSLPAIRKNSPSPNSQPVPSRAVTTSTTGPAISS
jgi:hypothetical protein